MTEEARISELLKPRRKVIAGYPGSEFEIGDILVKDAGLYYLETSEGLLHLSYPPHMIEPFPHLFREMQWHKERKPEEMPEYVIHVGSGEVAKVDRFDLETTSEWFMYLNGGAFPFCPGGSALENDHFLPATKTEYDQYIKTKQK